MATEPYIDVAQAAAYLNLGVPTIYKMVERKDIPCYRMGRKIQFKVSELDEWARGCRQEVRRKRGRPPKADAAQASA